jgi:hypothetical protein
MTFGLSSQEEMCIVFMYYYPRKQIYGFLPFFCNYGFEKVSPLCVADYNRNELLSPAALNRTFGLSFHKENCLDSTMKSETPATIGSDGLSSGRSSSLMIWMLYATLAFTCLFVF